MKKLIFLFATVFVASMTMAQNTASTTQSGDYNQSSVTQSVINEATVEQNSSATALGQKNNVSVNQSSSDLKSTAVIKQGNIATGKTSKKATATVTQTGFGNNSAEIYMHTTRSGQNDESTILQDGKDNQAISHLRSHQSQFEFTYVDQVGFDNYAYQLKDDEREGSLIIKQSSTLEDLGNSAKQYTHKDQARGLYIEQVGNNNSATQDIYKGSWSTIVQYGDNNTAEVNDPNNTNNHSTILQGDVDASGVSKSVDALLLATSFDNVAKLEQVNGDNNAVIVQKGEGFNTVNIKQGDGCNLNILQNGFQNTVMGLNSDPLAISLNGSWLDVDQIGSGNTLHLQQTNGASATVMQNGMTNTSVVIQN